MTLYAVQVIHFFAINNVSPRWNRATRLHPEASVALFDFLDRIVTLLHQHFQSLFALTVIRIGVKRRETTGK